MRSEIALLSWTESSRPVTADLAWRASSIAPTWGAITQAKHVEQPRAAIVANDPVILSPHCDCIQLNLTQAIALHPHALPQMPHRDKDMWRAPTGEIEYIVNVMWPFTPYREANGNTLIWPDSHGAHALEPNPDADPIAIDMDPGDALVFGSTLPGAGGNRADEIRRGAIVSYCLGWLKPYENQWLAYPPHIARTPQRAGRARRLPPAPPQSRQLRGAMPLDPSRRHAARSDRRHRRLATGPSAADRGA